MTVYIVRNKVNGKHYVGKTIQRLGYRWATHKRDARKGSDLLLHRAIRKYGVENFEIHPAYHGKESVTTEDHLFTWEKCFIQMLRSNEREFGYNLTGGGEGTSGLKRPKEGNPRYGNPLSEETKRKIGDANRGRELSEEQKQANRIRMKGYKHSAESRQKISAGNLGKKRSKESIAQGSETRRANILGGHLGRRNKSGCTGVAKHNNPQRKPWYAQIRVNSKTINLGHFLTFEEAVFARKAAELKYFGGVNDQRS